MNSKIYTIAYYTFKEVLKSKVLYGVVFIGLAIMLSVFVASEFTYGAPFRVAIDVGLGLLSLSSLGISLFLGVNLLSKEIESRTIYMIISRPVTRVQFILGKLLGLIGVLLINTFILSTMIILVTILLGNEIEGLFFWSIFFNFLESLLLLLVVTAFSLVTNTILSSVFSFVLLIAGHFIADTQNIFFVKSRPILGEILKFYHYVLPGFYKLNIKDFVIYKQSLSTEFLVMNTIYGLSYSAFLLFIIIYVFNRKNLD
jgi:ABC-2 type transport system permease protein